MILSERDGHVLAAIELDAEQTLREIADATGYPAHAVQRSLSRLLGNGIISRVPFVDGYRLGFTEYAIACSLQSTKAACKENFLRHLLKSGRVSWVGELSGAYRYYAAISARSVLELSTLLEKCLAAAGCEIPATAVAVVVSLTHYRRKYLAGNKQGPSPVSFGNDPGLVPVDDLDMQILEGLSVLSYRSLGALARQLALPRTTLEYRITQLTKHRVIKRSMYRTSSAALGMQYVKLLVKSKTTTEVFRKRMLGWCERHPHVLMLHHCIGAWDYEIGVEVENLAAASKVVDQYQEEFSGEIASLDLLPVLNEHAVGLFAFSQRK